MIRRRLPWILWCLTLVVCPVAIIVLGTVYERGRPDSNQQRPWPAQAVDSLMLAHLVASVIASIHVFWLTRGVYRWLAWVVVLVILGFTWLIGFGALMATTGLYL